MIVYEGPSLLNGEPIVGIITGLTTPSTNRKTGPMAQLWILDATEEPHEAVKSGADKSVCGDCPARGKWCYVTTFQGPLGIYRKWKRGEYDAYDPTRLEGTRLRFGAYGDPAAIPLRTMEELGRRVDRFTGYTHQWKSCSSELRFYCMASCDSESDARLARAAGWRTFRVTTDISDRGDGESICPASDDGPGKSIQCYDCLHCDGRARSRVKGNVVIQVHGAKQRNFNEEHHPLDETAHRHQHVGIPVRAAR